jgi:hypothetical protein
MIKEFFLRISDAIKVRNCLSYAFNKFRKEGGYLLVRKSGISRLHGVSKKHILNLVPHFLHMDYTGKITQLTRTEEENNRAKKAGPWKDWMWLWNFKGRVIEGDKDYLEKLNEPKT